MFESGPKFSPEIPKRKVGAKRFELLKDVAELRSRTLEVEPGSDEERKLNKKLTKLEKSLGSFIDLEDDLDALKEDRLEIDPAIVEEESAKENKENEETKEEPQNAELQKGRESSTGTDAAESKPEFNNRADTFVSGKTWRRSKHKLMEMRGKPAKNVENVESAEEAREKTPWDDDALHTDDLFAKQLKFARRGYPGDLKDEELRIIEARQADLPSDAGWDEIKEAKKRDYNGGTKKTQEWIPRGKSSSARAYWLEKLGLPRGTSWEAINFAREERDRIAAVKMLGLPENSTREEITAYVSNRKRENTALELGLDKNATWDEIEEERKQKRK